jgi:toxin YoeB
MAKKEIKWTLKAIHDKLDILDFWIERNKSKTYSVKLNELFDKSINSLSNQPEQGKKTNYKNIRIKIVRHYLVYYLIHEQHIEIVRIWDARRNPKKFKIE